MENSNYSSLDELFKSSAEYAKSLAKYTAIRFLEWCAGEGWQPYDSNEVFINLEEGRRIATSADLYDMFEHRNDWKTKSSVADVKIQGGLS